ncbi:TIGR01777 family oxidoreductase [Plantactinospora sp. BB1]|uniref:TIGR01777 family oxidoreductase n=1 Tax=Plantactinospora sp. BB1 TaxID=2071627 RepID=UPI000D15D4F8|nr:TIGR01777 family oxidoreductase [Plantactinospora sp. BB1]AVT39484.1 TIGR01777 family protein [Plantactinospora sp. BB1]
MRILIAGSSGWLGTRLTDRLRAADHDVVRLVRRRTQGPDEVRWDPGAGQLDPAVLVGVDAVVNLAGANIGDRRWTPRYKEVLRSSRVDSTGTLARAIAALPAEQRPRTLLNGSAIGWYGDTGDRPVEEDEPAGEGFMADLCRVWEAATAPAEQAGVRVVRLRIGLPLEHSGGLLKPQLLPYRLGIAGKFGSGRQWIPWISMADWLAAMTFLLDREEIAGPVNVVGPAPVTNAEFTRALGRALHRPTVMPVPGIALRILLGELSVESLRSLRVLPGVLNRAGFAYRHPDLASALQAALPGR